MKALELAGMSRERMTTDIIEVWNKIDLLDEEKAAKVLGSAPPNAVPVCAKDGMGVDVLLALIEKILFSRSQTQTRRIEFALEDSNKGIYNLKFDHYILIAKVWVFSVLHFLSTYKSIKKKKHSIV